MTISTTLNRIIAAGNSVTVAFPFPYKFQADTDLVVLEQIVATGVPTTLVLNTDYTVSGAGSPSGGTVTRTVATATGTNITIYRAMPQTQGVSLPNNTAFDGPTLEGEFDKLTMLAQQLQDAAGRQLALPVTSPFVNLSVPDPVSGKFLRWNAGLTGLENADITGAGSIGVPVSIANGGTNAVTAAAARASLVVVGSAGDTMTGALVMNGARIVEAHGADIASAATINLDTATGNVVDVTGVAAITAITLTNGARALVRFTGILVLTNGASLVLPGGVNITTAAGDYAEFRGYAAGVVRCANYVKASGLTTKNTAPTRQVFLSGSGTYNTPAGCTSIYARWKGGGGGGCASGTSLPGPGNNGGASTFNGISAGGGVGGSGSTGGTGGTASGADINIAGASGGNAGVATNMTGGSGGGDGSGPGSPANNSPGQAGIANTGGGGGGAGSGATAPPGAGGGSGGFCQKRFNAPAASYAYAVGAGGTVTAAGTGGNVGGVGGSGIVVVDEYYN